MSTIRLLYTSLKDWHAALLFDREADDVRAVLEFANVELLELPYLDEKLREMGAVVFWVFVEGKSAMSKRCAVLCALYLGGLLLGGCIPSAPPTPSGQQFAPVEVPHDRALIYFYRLPTFFGKGSNYIVRSKTQQIAVMTNSGYYPYLASPGAVHLYGRLRGGILAKEHRLVSFQAQAGKVYHFRFAFVESKRSVARNPEEVLPPEPRLVWVPPHIGEREIHGLTKFPQP